MVFSSLFAFLAGRAVSVQHRLPQSEVELLDVNLEFYYKLV